MVKPSHILVASSPVERVEFGWTKLPVLVKKIVLRTAAFKDGVYTIANMRKTPESRVPTHLSYSRHQRQGNVEKDLSKTKPKIHESPNWLGWWAEKL
jgi:hypothetical protein